MKIPLDMKAGTKHKTTSHGELIILNYINALEVVVVFTGTGYARKTRASCIREGKVKDRMLPVIWGVGFIGEGDHKASLMGVHTKEYSLWRGMLGRCYDQNHIKAFPSYKGCSVCEEWHNFQNFADWVGANYIDGHQLDKDIKVNGNKIYSPETCLFVSATENTEKAIAKSYAFINPNGVEVQLFNLNAFCKKNELNPSTMSAVHSEKRKQHKGWVKA